MIGSHDSFSYMEATSSIMNTISRFWRTQDKTIAEQYNAGVRFFDIRIKREVINGRNSWRVCHGAAEFPKVYTNLKSIFVYFNNTLKDCKYRIWLEKGDDSDWQALIKEAKPLIPLYQGLLNICRKDPYTVYYWSDDYILFHHYNAPIDWKAIVKHLFGNPIKDYAKQHNPILTQGMIEDKNNIYFMDYAV